MDNSHDIIIKQKFVSAIKSGLNETQGTYENNGKHINNARNFAKMDNIANSVFKAFDADINFKAVTLKRGSYIVALVYDKINGILYSLMTSSKLKELLDRKDHSHIHYWDGLVSFNGKLGFNRLQQVINESLFEQDNSKIDKIKNEIKSFLNNTEPSKYLTIEFSMNNFRLISVEAVLASEHGEVMDREDWSEFIEIDYSDISYGESYMSDDYDDLEISLKQNIERPGDISEKSITPKVDEKEKQS